MLSVLSDTRVCVCFQGEIDAHEDSFRSTDEAGRALLSSGHYASEEVKEKVSLFFSLRLTIPPSPVL